MINGEGGGSGGSGGGGGNGGSGGSLPKIIKGKVAWGFMLDKQAYGSEVDLNIEVKGKDIQARREIRGKIFSFMALLTKQLNYSLQKLVTGKTDIEDEIENLNKMFAEKSKGVKK